MKSRRKKAKSQYSKDLLMQNDNLLARTILDSLSAHVAILDENGFILETNRAWKRFAHQNQLRMRPETKNLNYLEICDSAAAEEGGESNVAKGIRDVIAGGLEEFVLDYPCHSPDEQRWFYMRVTRARGPGPMRIVVSHENITALRQTENWLRDSKEALHQEKKKLEEANTALKVLLQRTEAHRQDMEADVIDNLHRLIRPVLARLTKMKLQGPAQALIASLDKRLAELTRPFLRRLSTLESVLTPQEIEVASLIREGLSTKEIAAQLHLEITTVNFHRRNLRKKLSLSNTATNLQSFLMNLTQ
ncbi:transcriptional regulator, LuxR family [Desulfosarcina variabilis str. Montpellier]